MLDLISAIFFIKKTFASKVAADIMVRMKRLLWFNAISTFVLVIIIPCKVIIIPYLSQSFKNSTIIITISTTITIIIVTITITIITIMIVTLMLNVQVDSGNPDAKRLYDDLLSNYNKLVANDNL